MLYTKYDKARVGDIPNHPTLQPEKYRTQWRKDYARLIHSASFRRLQGKTQLFPGHESDFFRNRLTHSMEVAQIAKSIAIRLNYLLKKRGLSYRINTDLVEFAGLAHDIGHPPFGHQGEEALDERMIDYGGFEGNAQTLRLLSKIEKKEYIPNTKYGFSDDGKDHRLGLNLTARTLAAILKYDKIIPHTLEERQELYKKGKISKVSPVKGYYASEADVVQFIKEKLLKGDNSGIKLKTIECQIMDIADDIAYSTYDLEDAFKAGFIKPIDLLAVDSLVINRLINKLHSSLGFNLTNEDVQVILQKVLLGYFDWKNLYELEEGVILSEGLIERIHRTSVKYAATMSDDIAKNGYLRTDFSSRLVGKFIRSVDLKHINEVNPCLSTITMDEDVAVEVETLKHFTYEFQILSPKLKIVEYRGKEIVGFVFDTIVEHPQLLPYDYQSIYNANNDKSHQFRTICDFIAGMTDRYCIEFYAKLKSENSQTIFKPY